MLERKWLTPVGAGPPNDTCMQNILHSLPPGQGGTLDGLVTSSVITYPMVTAARAVGPAGLDRPVSSLRARKKMDGG